MAIIPINAPTVTVNFTGTTQAVVLPAGNVANLRLVNDGPSSAVVNTGTSSITVAAPVAGVVQYQSVLGARSERILQHNADHTHIAVMSADGGTGTLYIQLTDGDA
jgi:hypothetical protein